MIQLSLIDKNIKVLRQGESGEMVITDVSCEIPNPNSVLKFQHKNSEESNENKPQTQRQDLNTRGDELNDRVPI